MSERYRIDELERMGRAVYVTARDGIACASYDDLPDWRRFRWRRAALAAVQVAAEIDAERRKQWRRKRQTTVRVNT